MNPPLFQTNITQLDLLVSRLDKIFTQEKNEMNSPDMSQSLYHFVPKFSHLHTLSY